MYSFNSWKEQWPVLVASLSLASPEMSSQGKDWYWFISTILISWYSYFNTTRGCWYSTIIKRLHRSSYHILNIQSYLIQSTKACILFALLYFHLVHWATITQHPLLQCLYLLYRTPPLPYHTLICILISMQVFVKQQPWIRMMIRSDALLWLWIIDKEIHLLVT